MDPALVPYEKKRKIIDELNRVAVSVDRAHTVKPPSVIGFLQGIYDRYVGNVGVPRGVSQSVGSVEGFQSLISQQDSAKKLLTNFFGIWNTYPSTFTKNANLITLIETTWKDYVSSSTTDFTGTKFSSLTILSNQNSYNFVYNYSNKSQKSSFNYTVTIYSTTNNAISNSLSDTINPGYYDCGILTSSRFYIKEDGATTNYGELSSRKLYACYSANQAKYVRTETSPNGWPILVFKGELRFGGNISEYDTPPPITPGTGSITKLITISPAIDIMYITYSSENPAVTITPTSVLTTVSKLNYDFENAYTALIIDLYSATKTLFAITPAPAPTNTATDLSNALIGINVKAIQSDYLNTYYLPLQTSILQTTKTIVSIYLSVASSNWPSGVTQTTLTADQVSLNGIATTSPYTIITIVNIYNKYITNYTSIYRVFTFSTITEFIINTYIPARRYIQDTHLSTATVTNRQNARSFMNADGTMLSTFSSKPLTELVQIQNYCIEGIRDVVDTLIRKYYERLGTERPAADSIDSNTSLDSLKTLRDKYLPLWLAILTGLRTSPTTIDRYLTARTDSKIPTTDANYIQDNLTAGTTYTGTTPIVNIDKDNLTKSRLIKKTDGSVEYKYYFTTAEANLVENIITPVANVKTVYDGSSISAKYLTFNDNDGNIIKINATSNDGSNTIVDDPVGPFRSAGTTLKPGVNYTYYLEFNTPVTLSSVSATFAGSGTYNVNISVATGIMSGKTINWTSGGWLTSGSTAVSTTNAVINKSFTDKTSSKYIYIVCSHSSTSNVTVKNGILKTFAGQLTKPTELAIVDDTLALYTPKLNAILASFRQQAQNSLKAFTDAFTAATFPTDYDTNPFYATTRAANTSAPTDRATTIPNAQVIADINALKKTYDDALADLILAGKRTAAHGAIVDFNNTLGMVRPAYLTQDALTKLTTWSDISGAIAQAATFYSGNAVTDAFTAKTGAELDTLRTGTFEKATKHLLVALLDAYKGWRSNNYLKYSDLYADTGDLSRSDAQVDDDKSVNIPTAAKVIEVRDQYLNSTNGYWVLLKQYTTKTDSRVALLQAFTAFVNQYNEFTDVMSDTRPSYTNKAFEDIRTVYMTYEPSTKSYKVSTVFMSKPFAELDDIRTQYRVEFLNILLNDLRAMMAERIRTFLARREQTAAIIAKSKLTEPGLDSSDSSADFVATLDAPGLSATRKRYYGDPSAKPSATPGYIKLLEDLITAAILENKRQDTVAAIQNFTATYDASIPYIAPKSLSSFIQSYQAAAGTYITKEGERLKALTDLVLGVEADQTTTGDMTLFRLQFIYEECTRGTVVALIEGFQKGYAEKAGLQMPWSPDAAIQAVNVDTIAADKDAARAADMVATNAQREKYKGLWSLLDSAAKAQLTNQVQLFHRIKGVADKYGMLTDAAYASLNESSDTPTADTPFYNLQATYNSYDRAATSLLASMRTWIVGKQTEYDGLFKKYDGFQQDAFVVNVSDPPALTDFTNQTTADSATVNGFGFYTSNIESLVAAQLAKYVDEPNGALPRLKAFVRQQLLDFIPKFKAQWEASDSVTREEYTTNVEDMQVANDAAATSAALEGVMDHYFQYTDELREANLQQAVLYTMIDFNTTLFEKNAGIPLVIDGSTSQGKKILDAQRDILEGAKYLDEITKDAITDKDRLREIQGVYFTATYALADQIVTDLNVQCDAYLNLYEKYEEFRGGLTRENEAGKTLLAAPPALSPTITIVNVKAASKGDLSPYKQDLSTVLEALKATNADKTKETIRTQVAAFAAVAQKVREAIVEDLYPKLRGEIQTAMRNYIAAFGTAYDALAREEPKDPYTTRVTDAAAVGTGIATPTVILLNLIAAYTSYTIDLVTSDYQVRALQAITAFFTDLYVPNVRILPADLTTVVSPRVMQCITEAGANGGQTVIAKVVELNAAGKRSDLTAIRSEYIAAANDLAPIVIGFLKQYVTQFNGMYTRYQAFTAANPSLGEDGAFYAGIANVVGTLENPSVSQHTTLNTYITPITEPQPYSTLLRDDVNKIRDRVLADIETLRGFLKEQVGSVVTQYSQQYAATRSETLAKNTAGYVGNATMTADQGLIAAGKYDDFAAILDRYTLLARQLVTSRKQQKLLNTVRLFADDLLAPNEAILPPLTGQVATKKAQVAVDRVTAVDTPALAGSLDEKMETLAVYIRDSLDFLQSAYESAISVLIAGIRTELGIRIRQTKQLYRPNQLILRSSVPATVLSADANLDVDEGRVGTVEAPADINELRERYVPALAAIFTTVKTDMLEYMDEMIQLAGQYAAFSESNAWAQESGTQTLLTEFQNVPPITIPMPTKERQLVANTTAVTDAFIGVINGSGEATEGGLRRTIVLGTYPQLKNFVRDQLRSYIEYFNQQYTAISQKTAGFKTYYDAVKKESRDISGQIDKYETYAADAAAVATDSAPTSAKMEELLAEYGRLTGNLVTTNLQYRVGTIVFNFLDLLAQNFNILQLPADSAFLSGMQDAIGTTDAPGIAYQIANNLNTDAEIQNRPQLLQIESRFMGLRNDLVPVVKSALDAVLVEYDAHRSGYLQFYERNQARFYKGLANLDVVTYTDGVAEDRATVGRFVVYSADFVTTTNAIRTGVVRRLLGIKGFIGGQLDAYIKSLKAAYDATTSDTLAQNIVYSAQSYAADLDAAAKGVGLVGLMATTTSNTSAVLLSQKEEAVYTLIQNYATNLYSPNLIIVGEKERTATVKELAAGATAAIEEAKRRKGIGSDFAKYTAEMDRLDKTLGDYRAGIAEWLGILKGRLHIDLDTFRQLCAKYKSFDSALSAFFDLEPLPAELRDYAQVGVDLQKVGSIGSEYSGALNKLITDLRDLYYTDRSFSQIPALVRFMKGQLAKYIAKYSAEYEDIPFNIKPNCSFDGTAKKCDVGGTIQACINTREHEAFVRDGIFGSVADLAILDTMVQEYVNFTPCLQTAVFIKLRRIQTRALISDFKTTKEQVILDAAEIPYKFLARTINPVADLEKVDDMITVVGIEKLYADYKYNVTQLCFDAMMRFITLYVDNRYLEPYFIRSAPDFIIYSKFKNLMKLDIEQALDTVKKSADSKEDAAVDTAIVKNLGLAREYAGYCKTILEKREGAVSLYDRTEQYRQDTQNRITGVKDERAALANLVGLELSDELLKAAPETASATVKGETYIEGMTPIRTTYDGFYTEIRTKVHALLRTEIERFKTEMEKFGTLQKFFSADIQVAKAALDVTPNDLTRAEPVDGLDSVESRKLIETYRDRQAELVKQSDPNTGIMYTNARAMSIAAIDQYVARFQQVAGLAGGALLIFQPTGKEAILGTLAQVRVQGDYDKGKLAKAKTFETILFFYDMYADKEATMLARMRDYGARVIDDGFIKLYATIAEKGLESYISDAMKTAKAEVEANRQKITAKTVAYEEMLAMLQLYIGLAENVKLEVKRAEVRQVVERVLEVLKEVQETRAPVRFSADVPSVNAVESVLADVRKVQSIPILQQIEDQYTSVLALVNTEFAAWGTTAIQDFQQFYATAQKDEVTNFLAPTTAIQMAYQGADAAASTLSSKKKTEIAAIARQYTEARQMGEQILQDSQQAINAQRLRNTTRNYITTFKQTLETARTIPALVPDLATLDATIGRDEEAVASAGVTAATLQSLQKTYAIANAQVVTKVRQALTDAVTQFVRATTTAQAKKVTLSAAVRQATIQYTTDLKRAQAGTVLEMRDMLRKYAELTAAASGATPISADLTAARSEIITMITNFETLRGSVGSTGTAGISFTATVRTANPSADRGIAEKATRMEDLMPLRTKYVQMIYEVTTKVEEARDAAATAVASKKEEAKAAIAAFQSQMEKTPLRLEDYPQLVTAQNGVAESLRLLGDAATSLETATAILATYTAAKDVVVYGQTAVSAEDRAAKQRVALVAMNRFTELYQSQIAVADRFSQQIRNMALMLPRDISMAQNPIVSLSDLDALRAKYDAAVTTILTDLVSIQQDQVSEVTALIRTVLAQYAQITNKDVIPPNWQMDERIMNMDLATVGNPAVSANTVKELRTKYENWSKALREAVPGLPARQLAAATEKQRLGQLLRELNQLFLENMGVFNTLSTQLRLRIQKIADTFRYIRGETVGTQEVHGLIEDYRKALDEFKGVLAKQPTNQAVLDASLRGVMAAFLEAYKEADIYKLGKQDFNFVQLLVRSQSNVYVTQDIAGAIKAYSRGTELLKSVPKSAGQVVVNTRYNTLLETMNYFVSEWDLRNLGRAIPNDRLFLTNLKNNVASYKDLYKIPPPNMRNYGTVVDGLVDQYQQGLRVLRTYPMKK